jgi:hypothetical protein
LIIAVDNEEKTYEIAETARKHFTRLALLARTHGRGASTLIEEYGNTST